MKSKWPTCYYCGKRLRRYRWRKEQWAMDLVMEWGGYGDGFFCSQKHGHKWAVAQLKKKATL